MTNVVLQIALARFNVATRFRKENIYRRETSPGTIDDRAARSLEGGLAMIDYRT
jgi:hypothetical protein